MTLPSGAHIKLGSYEYVLDEAVDAGSKSLALYRPHYKYTNQSLFRDRVDVTGIPGKQQIRPERLVWFQDDWSGGENNRVFYEDDPTVYDFSFGLNPRIRGQLTSRPTRTRVTTNMTTQAVESPVFLAAAANGLWFAGGYSTGFSTDGGATYTAVDDAKTNLSPKSTSYRITAISGNDDYAFYAGWRSTSSGTRVIEGKKRDNTTTAQDVISEASNVPPFVGLTMLGRNLFAWTGQTLYILRVFSGSANWPLNANRFKVIGGTGVSLVNELPGTNFWGGITAGENQIWMFITTNARSQIYHYDSNGFGPWWKAPIGFSIKAIQYMNGVLYIGGHWGGDTSATGVGPGALYAYPMTATGGPVPVGFIRKQNSINLTIDQMAASYGNQVLMADSRTGRIFVYDADMDAFTMLDDIQTTAGQTEGSLSSPRPLPTDTLSFPTTSPTKRIGSILTFGANRVVSIYQGGTSGGTGSGAYEAENYSIDEPASRQAGTATNSYSAALESGTWDFDLPFDKKTMMGFDCTFVPMVSGQSIVIDYSLDSAAWTNAGTLTSASTGNATGRSYIQVSTGSSTVQFSTLRTRLTLVGTSGVLAPIVLGLASEAQLIDYEETWDLIVRLKDALPGTRYGTSATMQQGGAMRDFLRTAASNKQVLTFLDGYRYEQPGRYSTHTVTVENPEDIIIKKGEGSMMMTLRAIPS